MFLRDCKAMREGSGRAVWHSDRVRGRAPLGHHLFMDPLGVRRERTIRTGPTHRPVPEAGEGSRRLSGHCGRRGGSASGYRWVRGSRAQVLIRGGRARAAGCISKDRPKDADGGPRGRPTGRFLGMDIVGPHRREGPSASGEPSLGSRAAPDHRPRSHLRFGQSSGPGEKGSWLGDGLAKGGRTSRRSAGRGPGSA